MSISEFSIPERYKTDRRGPIRWIWSHVKPTWYLLVLAVIGASGNAYLAGVPAARFGEIFNELISGKANLNHLWTLSLIIGGSQIIRGGFLFMRNFSFEYTAQRLERNIREEFYTNLLGKSMTFHSLQSIGDLMARATNDIREVNFVFSPALNMIIGSINFLFVPLIIGWNLNHALVLVPGVFIVAYIICIQYYFRVMTPISKEVRESFGKMNSRLAEDLDGIETVKSVAQEDDETTLFMHNSLAYRNAFVKKGDQEAVFIPVLLLSLALGLGLLHAILLAQNGLIPLGGVVAYFYSLALLGFPTYSSIYSYSQLTLGVAGAKRLLETMNTVNDLDQNLEGIAQKIKGDVVFENVSFTYSGIDTLDEVSFHAQPGQTIAIVGQTGAGKTTLIRLINRTYDPSHGMVKIDGIPLKDWQLNSLRNQISIIEQDIFLFSKTVRENIAFGRGNASEAEVVEAAKKAQAHQFILGLPQGYDTVIGERGATLSGGQRQRLALARAFLTDPRILILDDSTSAIDSKTEDEIQKAIKTASEGRTTFIITHRLSQIRWADLIIVMKKGKITDIGTHTELMARSQAYRNIFTEAGRE
ncbi:MAG TPA: ABC transporter ATP-binding protein [Anaerolineaceae bacterium]|nr:ABC transporter ATP-binding protein [Anaerolineaceae bacterium]